MSRSYKLGEVGSAGMSASFGSDKNSCFFDLCLEFRHYFYTEAGESLGHLAIRTQQDSETLSASKSCEALISR